MKKEKTFVSQAQKIIRASIFRRWQTNRARGVRAREPTEKQPFAPIIAYFVLCKLCCAANRRQSMLSVPKRAFCSFSECDKREYRESADGLECLRKIESASSGGTEKNATRQLINSNCFLVLARLRTLKTLAPIASSSRASKHVFLPVSVLCARAYREA